MSTLRELAEKATVGPVMFWESWDPKKWRRVVNEADRELIALAPELARLASDMADALEEYDAQCECGTCLKARDLLARYRELEGRTGKETA